jgi:hypothetical protein
MRMRLDWKDLLVILAMVGFSAGLLTSGGDFDKTHRYPPPGSRPSPGMAGVAGEYYLGNGLGTNLRLSILPDGRYSFVSSGCTGVHHRESGFVQQTSGRYVLSPVEPGAPSVKRKFVLIGWGQRHYLVPPDEMQDLRDAISDGREPRDDMRGRFYIRLPIAPAKGLPDWPPEWANALSEEVLLGRVTAVKAEGPEKVGRATVNLGAKEGLHAGDLLTVQRPGAHWVRHLKVVSVIDHSCVADECFPDASELPLEPGLAVIALKMKEGDEGR